MVTTNILPVFTFGSSVGLPGGSGYNRSVGTSSGTYENFNPIHTYQDNISKVNGHHAFKAGAYFETDNKIDVRDHSITETTALRRPRRSRLSTPTPVMFLPCWDRQPSILRQPQQRTYDSSTRTPSSTFRTTGK